MLGFFKKKKRTNPTTDQLEKEMASAREDVKQKWVYFNETVPLKEGVLLSQKIDMFVQPIQEFFQKKYPILLSGPTEIFWLTVFTAILESGTHSKEIVNEAIEELQKKYAE